MKRDKPMTVSLETLRRRAKALKRAAGACDAEAMARAAAILDKAGPITHADALHVVAREEGADSWPKLKLAREVEAEDRAQLVERLERALYLGRHWIVRDLLEQAPDLASDNFGLQCALYDIKAVDAALARDPGLAVRAVGTRRPILHLAFSRHLHGGGRAGTMIAVADALLAAGADVDDGFLPEPSSDHQLSALYGAIGHGDNMVLGRWLLHHGANPNDNESLYHATELGHHEGLKLLLSHGAIPDGTNALYRAMDFGDVEAVRMLLGAGATPDDGQINAMGHAARRWCGVEMAELLLAHGADPNARTGGRSAYAMARVHGNHVLARVLEAHGANTVLTDVEAQLARAADGKMRPNDWIDMAMVDGEYRHLITRLTSHTGTLDHIRRLVAMGFDANATDEFGMPPFHMAGWEGLPDKLDYFLSLRPDLSHVNGYGGTLFSTILHGAENCLHLADRDHLGCMRLALDHGVALPRSALAAQLSAQMFEFLADWAEERPGQVVDEGIV